MVVDSIGTVQFRATDNTRSVSSTTAALRVTVHTVIMVQIPRLEKIVDYSSHECFNAVKKRVLKKPRVKLSNFSLELACSASGDELSSGSFHKLKLDKGILTIV